MKSKVCTVLFWLFVSVMYLLAVVIFYLAKWGDARFNVSFDEILFTITSPLKGSDVSFFEEAINYIAPYVFQGIISIFFICLVAYVLKFFMVILRIRIVKWNFQVDLYKPYRCICLIVAVAFLLCSINYGLNSLGVVEYLTYKMDETNIYEEYYVDPISVQLSQPKQKKNIIYIYLESMENTYASKDEGGAQEINYIPNLTQLSKDNISFSGNGKLGGSITTTGTTWTMGALFGSTTGVPFAFPVGCNSMDQFETFAAGIVSLGDILNEFGYEQYFLCGSDGDFAGRKSYFEQHGDYKVLDYYYAIEQGYIEDDYYVWWGYEDQILYDIAKKELLKVSSQGSPFNFTMLTVDTHHVDGYVCSQCTDFYDNQLANVLTCADKQIYDFITWCQEQDFYEDTVIVITGDHPRMDSTLIHESHPRRQYNCFINSEKVPILDMKNRTFTTLDLFPTVLSAMGYEIPGHRLGLGTDLFSSKTTLAEEMGVDKLNQEFAKYSEYYVETFD